jgi:hypothetical protein
VLLLLLLLLLLAAAGRSRGLQLRSRYSAAVCSMQRSRLISWQAASFDLVPWSKRLYALHSV